MKFFKKWLVFHRIFEYDFWKFSSFGGLRPSNPPTNGYYNILLNYWHNFREKFHKIILKIWKNGKNYIRTIQKSQVSIDFSTQISKNSLASGVPPAEPATNAYF